MTSSVTSVRNRARCGSRSIAASSPTITTIVNVQGDEPFIGRAARSKAPQGSCRRERFPLGTAASPRFMGHRRQSERRESRERRRSSAHCISRARQFRLSARRECNRVAESSTLQHIGVYAYSRDALEHVGWPASASAREYRAARAAEAARGWNTDGSGYCRRAAGSGIDTEDDLRRANARWQEFIAGR